MDSYKAIQTAFSKPTFLVHHDPDKQLYVDVDASKQRGFGVMMYQGNEVIIDDKRRFLMIYGI
jgi:hypothetical protein